MVEPLYFHGVWRMDFWFGNPNITAAFLATLAIGVWIFAYFGRVGFWVSAITSTIFACLLAHTLSRGGVVALVCGAISLACFAPRPWRSKHVVAVLVAVVVGVGSLFYFKTDERFAHGIVQEDKSITNRLLIWKTVPAMINASPEGWGFGNAARAYEQWFQPLDRHEHYLNLVSTHLTWLVEMSWVQRIGYIAFWIGILLLTCPTGRFPWFAVPFSVWITFFAAGIFTHVAQFWQLWLVPGLFSIAVLASRIMKINWPSRRAVVVATSLIAISCFGLVVPQLFPIGRSSIRGTWERVTIGSKNPPVWILVDTTIVGQNFGRTLRTYLAENGNSQVGVSLSVEVLPSLDTTRLIVLGGSLSGHLQGFRNAINVTLINPKLSPRDMRDPMVFRKDLRVIFGEFSQSPTKVEWQEAGFNEVIEGKGDYLSDWSDIFMRK
ncbi:hypothetical protein DB345_05210 [Spartobacteria bacterium LR76]|nr:hypothetical protein DB345_05210 [Spartobacteria bacterium LR76]